MIVSAVIVGLVFVSGFFVGNLSNAEVKQEIRIGYQNPENADRVDYQKSFTDSENPLIIERFLMIYINKEKIENMELGNPDVFIELNNPKDSVRLIDSKLWFTDDKGIIGIGTGENQEQMTFYEIDQEDAAFIKKVINDEEGKR